jgi:hypothetical protein
MDKHIPAAGIALLLIGGVVAIACEDHDGASPSDASANMPDLFVGRFDAASDDSGNTLTCTTAIPSPNIGGIDVGGSNYVLWSAGQYLTTPDDATWYGPNGVKPVVGTYHQAPATVRAQLDQMAAAGQRKLAIVIWFAALTPGSGVDGTVTSWIAMEARCSLSITTTW